MAQKIERKIFSLTTYTDNLKKMAIQKKGIKYYVKTVTGKKKLKEEEVQVAYEIFKAIDATD